MNSEENLKEFQKKTELGLMSPFSQVPEAPFLLQQQMKRNLIKTTKSFDMRMRKRVNEGKVSFNKPNIMPK